jgi:hypothetical protein
MAGEIPLVRVEAGAAGGGSIRSKKKGRKTVRLANQRSTCSTHVAVNLRRE